MLYDAHTFIFFSPTGTTRRVLQAIGRGLGSSEGDTFDLTRSDCSGPRTVPSDSLALIGVPVYAGRVAPVARKRLEQVRGLNTPAVLVVLYGNRAYEDALLELRDLAVEAGFVPVAGAAFIGEHSYSTSEMPIAPGRPDRADLVGAFSFGEAVREKIAGMDTFAGTTLLDVPGNTPYKEVVPGVPIVPEVLENCTSCGVCVDSCPTGAIIAGKETTTDPEKCIRCCACVRACPEQARVLNAPRIIKIREFLCAEHSARKEPEVFV